MIVRRIVMERICIAADSTFDMTLDLCEAHQIDTMHRLIRGLCIFHYSKGNAYC